MRLVFSERHIYLLKKILQDDWTYSELREFFEFVKAHSKNYLIACERNNLRVADSVATLDDIADDFMVDLFARDKNGFKHWRRYVEQNGFPDLETAQEFFYSIIKKKSQQGLQRLFYERDRQGFNNVRMLTKFADNYSYKVKQNGTGKFLIHKDDAGKEIMPESDFAKVYELYLRCANAPSMSTIAEKMLESIEASPTYARVLNLGMLNKAIKTERKYALKYANVIEYKRNGYVVKLPVDEPERDAILQGFIYRVIDEHCQDYRNNTPWAQNDYWKLAPIVKQYFDNAMSGHYESMYNCFSLHIDGVTNAEFIRTYKPQTDYLLKVVQKKVRDYLFKGKCRSKANFTTA